MKTLQRRIQEAAKHSRVSQLVVERDHAQGHVLLGLGRQPALRETLVFKGGTALKKIHLGSNYRFSEDLDFSAINGPTGKDLEHAVRAAVADGRAAARQFADVDMTVERHEERMPHPGGQEAFVVRVQFPWQRQAFVSIKIEITHDEPVLLPAPVMAVTHGYDESIDASIRAYHLDEIAAEKLRATRQTQAKLIARGWVRPRARDYYDLWHLVRLEPGRLDWSRVAAILPQKCSHRQVRLESLADVFDAALLGEVRASWARTVGPFVTELPEVEQVLSETRDRLDELLRL